MDPDDFVCLCHRVSLRKLRAYLLREKPPSASCLSNCLGAGTGCGWCRTNLERLWESSRAGVEPTVDESAAAYGERRAAERAALAASAAPGTAATKDAEAHSGDKERRNSDLG